LDVFLLELVFSIGLTDSRILLKLVP